MKVDALALGRDSADAAKEVSSKEDRERGLDFERWALVHSRAFSSIRLRPLRADPEADWIGLYYQYANRLAHVYFFREILRQVLGDRGDLVRRQANAMIGHHPHDGRPALGRISCANAAEQGVTAIAIRRDYFLACPIGQFLG